MSGKMTRTELLNSLTDRWLGHAMGHRADPDDMVDALLLHACAGFIAGRRADHADHPYDQAAFLERCARIHEEATALDKKVCSS